MAGRLRAGWRDKIKRADKHIDELRGLVAEYVASDPYRVESNRDGQTGQVALYFVRHRRPCDTISLVAGDAAHNLRSALDHFAYQWVSLKGTGAPTTSTAFPLYPRRFSRKVMRKGKSSSLSGYDDNILRVLPGITLGSAVEAVFERLQPYHRRYRPLWHIQELDRLDKHRLLQVTSSRLARAGLGIGTVHDVVFHIISLRLTATMKKRAKFADVSVIVTGPNPHLDVNPKPTVRVVFGKGPAVSKAVAGKEVVATLEAARDLIRDDVFPRLEALL